MEWYWIALIIVVFFGLAWLLIHLGKKGILGAGDLGTIKQLTHAADMMMDAMAGVIGENEAHRVFDIIVGLVDKAVLAAENAWYNGEITREERKARCIEILGELLKANGIEMPESIRSVLDSLIAAACEAMGHTAVDVQG